MIGIAEAYRRVGDVVAVRLVDEHIPFWSRRAELLDEVGDRRFGVDATGRVVGVAHEGESGAGRRSGHRLQVECPIGGDWNCADLSFGALGGAGRRLERRCRGDERPARACERQRDGAQNFARARRQHDVLSRHAVRFGQRRRQVCHRLAAVPAGVADHLLELERGDGRRREAIVVLVAAQTKRDRRSGWRHRLTSAALEHHSAGSAGEHQGCDTCRHQAGEIAAREALDDC